MPPKKHPTIWEAAPHTIAKIDILKGYLQAWFAIMGRFARRQPLLYIDGFAGPGEYTNHATGSPIAAAVAGRTALTSASGGWQAGEIHCAFIEAEVERFANLEARLVPFLNDTRLRIHLFNSSFIEGLAALEAKMPTHFQGGAPLLAFIDPFGATGAPFATVARILGSPASEVLINLDADGISRILLAGASADHERLLYEIFGDDTWREELSPDMGISRLCAQVLALYKRRLHSLPGVRYVFSFEMRDRNNTLTYFLVFASQHPKGLEKMKEAMKKLDQDGSYCFTDGRVDQPTLFRYDDVAEWSRRLYATFRGQKTGWASLNDYALNETPFTNPKSMLKDLEKRDLIRVDSGGARRTRLTFPEEKVVSVEFEGGGTHGQPNQH
jgi:three-Cys-motif partner protein